MIDLLELVAEETMLRGHARRIYKGSGRHCTQTLSELHLTDEQIIKIADVTPKLVTRLIKKVHHVN